MNTRLRLFVILIGALLVIGTYTFPLWQPLLESEAEDTSFPGLEEALQPAFRELSAREQRLYLTMRQENPQMALAMLRAQLDGDVVVPEDGQVQPDVSNAIVIRRGAFINIDPDDEANAVRAQFFPPTDEISPYQLENLWEVEGNITMYRFPNNSRLVWLSDFVTTPGPNLRVALVRDVLPLTFEQMGMDFLMDVPLLGNIGNQGFFIGADQDISGYQSIVIYDATWNVIFGVAPIIRV